MPSQRLGCGLRIRTATPNSRHTTVGFDHVALSAEQKCLFFVADQEQCFEVAQEFISAPIFGEFHGAASEIAVVLLEFRFEAAEEREGVGGRAGESSENFVVVKAADLFCRVFDDGLAERDLSIAGENHAAIAADG